MEKASVSVKIYNSTYALTTSASEEQVLKIAAEVDRRMQELAENKKLLQTDKIAIWTALDLAADRLELQNKCAALEQELQEKGIALEQEMQQKCLAAEQKMQEKYAALEQKMQQERMAAEQELQKKYAVLEQEMQQKNAALAEKLQRLQARYDRLQAEVRER